MARQIVLIIALVTIVETHAVAQTSAGGSVRGVVRDEQGGVLPGVTVTAVSPTVGGARTAVSDAAGYYRLLDLPPAEYTLKAELQGFSAVVRENMVVRAGLNLAWDFEMKIGAVAETLTVTADTPMLETKTAIHAVNISGELQREVPLFNRRDYADFMLLTPGVTLSWSRTFQNYSVHASTSSAHVFQLDGVDMMTAIGNYNTNMNLSTEAIQDTVIKTGGVDASAPIGVGAVVNIVTKSGTDRLSGSETFVAQPIGWNGNNAPGGGSTTGMKVFQPDLSIGGPLAKGRAWFFGAYRYTNIDAGLGRSPQQLTLLYALVPGFQDFVNDTRGHYYMAKATGQLSPSHQLQVVFQKDRGPSGYYGPEMGDKNLRLVQGGPLGSARFSSVLSSSLTTRLTASYNTKDQVNTIPHDDRPSRPVYQSVFPSAGTLVGSGTFVTLDNGTNGTDFPASKITLAGDATYYRTGPFGSHEIQTGVYLQPRMHTERTVHYPNDGFALEDVVLRDPNNPAAGYIPFHRRIYDTTRVTTQNADARDYAAYIQDAWKPNDRVTVSGGVRIDMIKDRDNLFNVVVQDSKEVGPRFGINYVLTKDQRNVVRSSWVRVAEGIPVTLLSAGTVTAGFRDEYSTKLNGVFDTVLVTPSTSAQRPDQFIDPSYHQPFVDEWILGYQRQLQGQTSVDLSFVRRNYRDRRGFIETNGIYRNGVFEGYRNPALNQIVLVKQDTTWPVYSALDLEVSKQTSSVQLIASYLRQWRHIAGDWQPNDPASFIQPSAFPNDKGIGSLDSTSPANSFSPSSYNNWRDHYVRVGVTWLAPWNLVFANNYTFQSGVWSGPIITRIAAPDPRFGPPTVTLSNGRVVSNPLATTLRFAFPTRGDGQINSGGVHTWNTRVARRFNFGRYRLQTSLDVFNVINADGTYGFLAGANQVFSSTYGMTTIRQFPRSVQAAISFAF